MEDLIKEIEAKTEQAIEKIKQLQIKVEELEKEKEDDTAKLKQLAEKLTVLDVEAPQKEDQYSLSNY